MRIFAQVCSRCFGWGLPTTTMIPMADNLNHSHITVVNETINLELQRYGDDNSKYYTKDKFMNDYSVLFEEENIENEQQKANIIGRFNRERYNINIQKYSLENWKKELEERQIWDVTYKGEDYEEDNDTSEEEDEEPYNEPIYSTLD